MAILADAALAETRDYLLRVRRFADDSDDTVRRLWARAFTAWVDNPRHPGWQCQMDDAGAELGLRNVALPIDRVRAAADKLIALNLAADPGEIELRPAIAEQLRQRRQPN